MTTLPVGVCLRNGFDLTKLYKLTYTVKDPYVLGAGTAAFRDVRSFFRYATSDDFGTPNPVSGRVDKGIVRDVSQSGDFVRHLIFLGMNEDEEGRLLHEGAWPLIAGRRVANNSRWGQPDGVLELYQMGSEGPQWWHSFPDRVRDVQPGGILDRCSLSGTCPKIVETFGGAEVLSVWPHMRGPKNSRDLVEPTMQAMGFPAGIPGIAPSIFSPDNFVFPVLDYAWGPFFDEFNATGVPTQMPPPILHVIKMLVPRVDADGNELGGVPTVQRDAPLGTYLGWNITAGPGDIGYDAGNPRPFHAGQVCNYVGGMVPFAITKAQRTMTGDPRLSLEERYGNHAGYVAAVRAAADNAACQGYLHAGAAAAGMGAKCTGTLPPGVADDWAALVNQAINSDVLN